MYRVGEEEVQGVGRVLRSGNLFRYQPDGQCVRFEKRFAEMLGVEHATLTASGTSALTAGLASLEIGPGDEVIVPAHTYMATAVAVLAVGAIPVIVDIDESLTLCPDALEEAIGPRTRAVIPVHMWGLPCDMGRIMAIAKARKLWVVEDACQAMGGGFEGQLLGSIGHVGAFSFNHFKILSSGEGGVVVTHDEHAARVIRCMTDCCSFFWNGRDGDLQPFAAAGSRASEIDGAILHAQLDRLDGILADLRRNKRHMLKALEAVPGDVRPNPCRSPEHECATHLHLLFPSEGEAQQVAKAMEVNIAANTGRHTYHHWTPILERRAGHHPSMNPFTWPANQQCRMDYHAQMCPRSLEILGRTVMIPNHPDNTEAQSQAWIDRLREAVQAATSVAK